MSVVLAAIDNSAAAKPVLELARELARLMGAEVEMVHVDEEGTARTAAAIAGAEHLPLHRRQGDVATAIAATANERDAIAVVLGARGLPAGASPAGHVTMELVQALDTAVAVAPPHAEPRPVARVLVAVEGDGESHALSHLARHFEHSKLEIVALHVLEPEHLPLFGDQPVLETEAWVEEFGRRSLVNVDGEVRLEVRVGDAARAVLEVAQELDVDLVVIAWHRELGHGHGRLVRAVLAGADVPVLLVPLPRQA